MQGLRVAIGEKTYPILIGENLLKDASLWADLLHNRPFCIVTDSDVAAACLDQMDSTLSRENLLVLPAGETHKNLHTLTEILTFLTEQHFARDAVLIAFGGGVIGDMVGFAAAIYQRGIEFIQVPTTTLAMLDSSVGGKTAVNLGVAKNNIGAFHQPSAVVMDLVTLNSLPEREYRAGIVEAIKHGLIRDAAFFEWICDNEAALKSRNLSVLSELIQRSCLIKAEIVAQDETEQGLRMLLNFGHTFGHALEAYSDYQDLKHGEAVAIGMMCALRFSQAEAVLKDEAVIEKTAHILRQLGLPSAVPAHYQHEKLVALMQHDKKKRQGRLNLILLRHAGEAIIQQEDLCKIRF